MILSTKAVVALANKALSEQDVCHVYRTNEGEAMTRENAKQTRRSAQITRRIFRDNGHA